MEPLARRDQELGLGRFPHQLAHQLAGLLCQPFEVVENHQDGVAAGKRVCELAPALVL